MKTEQPEPETKDAVFLLDPHGRSIRSRDLADNAMEVMDELELGIEDSSIRGDYHQHVREVIEELTHRCTGEL